jgi:hypothetical protein
MWVAAAGLGLMAAAAAARYFATLEDAADDHLVLTLRFLGLLALPVGMALVAFFQRGLGWGVRCAFLVAAAYFMTHVPGAANLVG